MAKEIAISKRLKISEAQKYMILSVLGASIVLGVAISLVVRFTKQIAFNADVIAAEEQSIVSYSNVIKNTGVCEKPKGTIYTDKELKDCDPDSIEVSKIPGTLRANVLENVSANEALNSVPKVDNADCYNESTEKNYTLKELREKYKDARGAEELQNAANLIKKCSALRVIPDALPSVRNDFSLLASLNNLFIISGWNPISLGPDDSTDIPSADSSLGVIPVNLLVESDTSTTMRVLNNIERSIRDFDIYRATIEWGSNDTLILQARAAAYYTDPSTITETNRTITPGAKSTKKSTGGN